jgi:hypothetical protein
MIMDTLYRIIIHYNSCYREYSVVHTAAVGVLYVLFTILYCCVWYDVLCVRTLLLCKFEHTHI